MAFRSDALIADASLSPSKLYRQILTTRDRVGG